MKDYCKDLKSSLSPTRDKMVRDMVNYLCRVREKVLKINPAGKACVQLITDSHHDSGKEIWITGDRSVSKIFEDVNEKLPRKFNNRLFILRCWALKMKWGEFYQEA